MQLAEAEEVERLLASARATVSGARKDVSGTNMPKSYHPKIVETAW